MFILKKGHQPRVYVPLRALFLVSFISRFGFKSGFCLLIAPVPAHCFSITFFFSKHAYYISLYTNCSFV